MRSAFVFIFDMFRKTLYLFSALIISGQSQAQPTSRPFPQHVKYFKGAILPNLAPQSQLDKQVTAFYDQWKGVYVKYIPGTNQAYIWFGEKHNNKQCVSEGQGYGMVITVLMAGYDPKAEQTYDALFRYYHAHPSGRGKHLMAWAQKRNEADVDHTSATDGDLDIAYSLLLADKQWGSRGDINYLREAKLILNDIYGYEINPVTHTVLMSDAIEHDSKDFFDTRTSDFMPANFAAFEKAINGHWSGVEDSEFSLMQKMEETYSPDAGLLPDFIVGVNKYPKPAPPHFLESRYDGCYNYNACRDPWRIGVDYLLYGDKRAKAICDKINRWIRGTTNNDTYNLSAGYTLEGNDIKGRYYEALSFSAPFAVSAMVDAKNQAWLNKLWIYLNGFKLKDFDYYDNTIKMLDMIIISGNYWSPN